MIIRINANEQALGFVESLIAIMVAGIACIALLSVAVMVMKEAKNNEYRDAMNQYAVEGFEQVRSISVSDYSQIFNLCDSDTEAGHFNVGTIQVHQFDVTPCSDGGDSDESCEYLSMPGNEDVGDTFYREIYAEDVSSNCSRVRIIVKVGLLPVNGETRVRNFQSNVEMVGYVVE